MRYISTRGQAPVRDFAGALLAGLAEDGGLYVPETWPHFTPADWRGLRGVPYPEVAARVMQPFVGDALPFETLQALCHKAYAGFRHPAVVPVVQLETGLFVQELFHGPTLAFKDMALQLLGPLFDHVLTARDARVTIVGATSGDTGSAAIEAFAGLHRVDIMFLHPHGRISEVQRRQMTTVHAANVGNIAIEGTFDDCQDMVKAMFADVAFRKEMNVSAVNSINWARIAAQISYYVAAGAPDREVAFSGPDRQFRQQGPAARRMGLPVTRLIAGSNRNDILARFLASNDLSIAPVEPSLSPSSIQVSSGFERLWAFELPVERDAGATAAAEDHGFRRRVDGVRGRGGHRCPHGVSWFPTDDTGTRTGYREAHDRCGYLADRAHRHRIAAAGRSPDTASRRSRWRRRIRRNFPMRSNVPRGCVPRAAVACRSVRSAGAFRRLLPYDLAAVQAQVRALARRNS